MNCMSKHRMSWEDEDECEQLAAEDRKRRRYNRKLLRHPHCSDPDHPGCERCLAHDEEEEE